MELWEELAAIVPGGVVGEISSDLLVGEVKFLLWSDLGEVGYHKPTVIPTVNWG